MPAIRTPRLPVRPVRRRPAAPVTPEEVFPEPAIITANGIRWVHIPKPRHYAQEWLERHFEFHPLDYEDIYSRNQRPKVDRYDDYLFVVLQFPRYDRDRERLNVVEMDLFVGHDYVITLPNADLEPIDSLFARCRESEDVREPYFEKGAAFLLYKIVDHAVDASFPMLRKMGQKLERIEDEIFEGRSEEPSCATSPTSSRRSSTSAASCDPQRVAFRDLERAMDVTSPEELDVYFDDVIDASERIWDTLENYKEVVEGLESTNESVLSHNVNDTLRVLTSITVIVLPLTLLASVFGMNVAFPGEGEAIALRLHHHRHAHRPHRHGGLLPDARLALNRQTDRAPENARDRALVEQAKAGELEAFNRLVELYQDYLFSMTVRVVRDRDVAEDAVQEAFFSAYRNLDALQRHFIPSLAHAHRHQRGTRHPAQAQAPAQRALSGVGGRRPGSRRHRSPRAPSRSRSQVSSGPSWHAPWAPSPTISARPSSCTTCRAMTMARSPR